MPAQYSRCKNGGGGTEAKELVFGGRTGSREFAIGGAERGLGKLAVVTGELESRVCVCSALGREGA